MENLRINEYGSQQQKCPDHSDVTGSSRDFYSFLHG